MIQVTSLESFMEILPELGELQGIVYNAIKTYPGLSNREIANVIGKPINCVTPRVKELRNMGLVVNIGIKFDEYTNRNVMIWKVKS